MGGNPLDEDDAFWEGMENVIFICVRKDKTINLKTSVKDMEELRSIFSTAYLMAVFHDTKLGEKGLDNLH